jgi:hypothetical protein
MEYHHKYKVGNIIKRKGDDCVGLILKIDPVKYNLGIFCMIYWFKHPFINKKEISYELIDSDFYYKI